MHSSSFLTYFLLVLSLGMGALAQDDTAECLAGWEWNQNSLGQDPCKLGMIIDADCRGEVNYGYVKVGEHESYVPPAKNHTGDMECDCNTVMYSLFMACATCQTGFSFPWYKWSADCDIVYVTQYPRDLPQGTAVPHWAFFDITTLPGGTYTNINAESVGRDPEAIPKKLNNTKTASGGPNATGAVVASSSSGRNVGAIAGGVVGGVVALIIIAIIAFFVVRHRRKNRDQGAQPQYEQQGVPADSWKTSPTSPAYDLASISSGPTVVPSLPFQPYNPGDPMGMVYQTDLTPTRRPVTYVTPISNYPDRR